MVNYIAVIHKEADSDFGVSFPDFPGCITAGSTIDEAKDMAKEALELHIEGMLEDADIIPAPSSLEHIMSGEGYKDSVAVMVVTVADYKKKEPVRVNISVDPYVLEVADQVAAARGLTRSGFITMAIRREAASGEFLENLSIIKSRLSPNKGKKHSHANRRVNPAAS